MVPVLKELLTKHHELYSSQCKAELWEELLAKALTSTNYGSDWKPDCNHKSGVDQTTNDGTRISNKSGQLKDDYITISGSRLTKHGTLEDKIKFLSDKKEDYILCLATDKNESFLLTKRYYFVVIDSSVLDYANHMWTETYGKRGVLTNKVNGWKCQSKAFSAKINKNMSDQLWIEVKLDYCEEFYEITVG